MNYFLSSLTQETEALQLKEQSLIDLLARQESEKEELTSMLNLALTSIGACKEQRQFFETIVGDCLSFVFQKDFKFEFLELYKDDNYIGLDYQLKKGSRVYPDIIDGLGASVAGIIDAVTRILTIFLNPNTANLLIADEFCPELSDHHWSRFGLYLTKFCEAYNFQIVLTTHHKTEFGRVYRVTQSNEVSNVELELLD